MSAVKRLCYVHLQLFCIQNIIPHFECHNVTISIMLSPTMNVNHVLKIQCYNLIFCNVQLMYSK